MGPVVELYAPIKVGTEWIAKARVQTPFGPIMVEGRADEQTAAKAVRMLRDRIQPRVSVAGYDDPEVAGIFGDFAKAISRVAKNKALGRVLDVAKSVVRHPIFGAILKQIPIVSNVVNAADATFALADGLKGGVKGAVSVVQKLQASTSSSSPDIAKKAAVALRAVEMANKASSVVRAARAGNATAQQMIVKVRADAQANVPGARETFNAITAARRYDLRKVAAGIATAAAAGDPRANATIARLERDASTSPAAREAFDVLREVVSTVPRQDAQGEYVPNVLELDESGRLKPQHAQMLRRWQLLQTERRAAG